MLNPTWVVVKIERKYFCTDTLSGSPLVFSQFFQGFPNFFQVFKSTYFRSIFSLKLSLRLKTMLNSIKTLKRYCKATLNIFFNKKKLMMTKKIYLNDRFLCQIEILLLNMLKLFKVLRFSRFQGKVATQ